MIRLRGKDVVARIVAATGHRRKARAWGCCCHRVFCLAVAAWMLHVEGTSGFVFYDPFVLSRGRPNALNAVGQVAGSAGATAVVWAPSTGNRQELAPGTRSDAKDINDSGDVVATGIRAYSVLWRDGNVVDLERFGGTALNNLLQVVVGGSIWEGGQITPMDGVVGSDINDHGQVAGNLYGTGAVIWDAGTVAPVGPPGVLDSEAHGINESGQVVGQADMPDRYGRGFLWDGVESVILAALGDKHASAEAINDLVQIVGWSDTPAGDRHAVLWEEGAIADLNDLLTEPFPYTLVDAVDINNRGQIACRAEDASGGSWAVLLNPIPEPGTVLLLAAGAALAGRRQRRG